MQTSSRGYTDAQGRPEIVAATEFKTGLSEVRIVERASDEGGQDGEELTAAPPPVAASAR
jgi:hypothetical protein